MKTLFREPTVSGDCIVNGDEPCPFGEKTGVSEREPAIDAAKTLKIFTTFAQNTIRLDKNKIKTNACFLFLMYLNTSRVHDFSAPSSDTLS